MDPPLPWLQLSVFPNGITCFVNDVAGLDYGVRVEMRRSDDVSTIEQTKYKRLYKIPHTLPRRATGRGVLTGFLHRT